MSTTPHSKYDEDKLFNYRNTCLVTAACFGTAGVALILDPHIVSKLYFHRVELRPFSAESWRLIGSLSATVAALLWGASSAKDTATKLNISRGFSLASLLNFGVWAYVCASTEHDLGSRRMNALPLIGTLGGVLAALAAFSFHSFNLSAHPPKESAF